MLYEPMLSAVFIRMKKKDLVGFIITSNVKNEKYWGGKGFCSNVVKQYFNYQECIDAITSYWFNDFVNPDDRDITFKSITSKDLEKMLAQGLQVQ